MNTRSKRGLAILAGGLSFVGAANATDLIIDGSFEQVMGGVSAYNCHRDGTDAGWNGIVSCINYSFVYFTPPAIPASENPGSAHAWRHQSAVGAYALFTTPTNLTDFLQYDLRYALNQTVNLTNAVSGPAIDAGYGLYTLSSWLASYTANPEQPFLLLRFFDTTGTNQLGSDVIFDRTANTFAVVYADGTTNIPVDLSADHAWIKYVNSGIVPPGAREASVYITRSPNAGLSGSPDTYVDLVKLDVINANETTILDSATPADNASNVSPAVVTSVTLRDLTTQVNTNSIHFSFDGVLVSPSSVSKSGPITTVQYVPPGILPPLSAHTYIIVWSDNGVSIVTKTNQFQFTVAPYVNITLGPPIYLETFDSVSEGSLPSGWSVTNLTDVDVPGYDLNDVHSDAYLNWVVISRSTLSNIVATNAPDLSTVLNVAPNQVINNSLVTNLASGNFIFADSDHRGPNEKQIQYLFTGPYNLSGHADVYLSFNNLWTQYQNSMGSVEYSIDGGVTWLPALYLLDGPDILSDSSGNISPSNTLATAHGDVADVDAGTLANGHYGQYIGVNSNQWATLGSYLSARVSSDTTESKRVEFLRLSQADNQSNVRFRFANVGENSWYFGIDNFGLYSGAVVPPQLDAVVPASRADYVGATAIFTANGRGAIPLGYQWRKNGVGVPGQTSSILSLPNIQMSDAGSYTVVVNSSGLSVTSSPPVSLTVLATPTCGVTDGLAVYLNFDNNLNGQGGTTNSGSVLVGAERYAPGIIGQAASFQNDAGAGQPSDWAVTLGNQDALYTNNFTVAFWLKTAVTSDGALTGNKDWTSGGNVGWLFDQLYTGFCNFRSSGGTRYDVGAEMRDGRWHHLALSVHRDTNGFLVYLDGAPVGTGVVGPTGGESLATGFDTLIGGTGPASYSGSGDVDDYAIWTRALSTEELTCVYANGLIGKSVDLLRTLPQLSITRNGSGGLPISWSTNFTGFTLESSPQLGTGAVWNAVPGVVNNQVVVSPGGSSKFYRLRKP